VISQKAIVAQETNAAGVLRRSICKFAAVQLYLFLMGGKRSLYLLVSEKIP
jgi:hypothetical protein